MTGSLYSPMQQRSSWKTIPLALLFLVGACVDESPTTTTPPVDHEQVRPIAKPNLPTLFASAPVLQTCGAPVEFKLTDGSHNPGRVLISNDAEKLYVTYEITAPTDAGWYISDPYLIATNASSKVPMDGANPNPWAFPVGGELDPVVTSKTFEFKLSDIGVGAGSTAYVSAMAGVVHPTTSNWDGPWEWIIMWGVNASGAKILQYTIASCGGTTPPPPPPPAAGTITLTFDDGWKTTYTNVYPVLKELGLKANIAINSQPIDEGWGDYMTLANVRELHNAGWAVVNHTVSHPDLTTLSASKLTHEIADNKAWIERNGFRGSHIFVVPFHSWGSRERTEIQKYAKAARGYTVDQFWPERYTKLPLTNPYDIYAFEPEYAPFTTADGRALTMQKVEHAIQNGELLDVFFHRVTSAQVPAFRELMQQIARYKANIRTYPEIIP